MAPWEIPGHIEEEFLHWTAWQQIDQPGILHEAKGTGKWVIISDPEHDCFVNPFISILFAEDFLLVKFLICGDQAMFMAGWWFLLRTEHMWDDTPNRPILLGRKPEDLTHPDVS